MTLVASFQVGEFPFLVGDIMVSQVAGEHEYLPFNVPTHADVNRVARPSTGYVVSGLVQKVVKLSDRLMIAWAGNVIAAQALTRDLRKEGSHATFESLANMLQQWRCEAGFDLYVTGLYLEPACPDGARLLRFGWDSQTGWQSNRATVDGYGECYYGGSGGGAFVSLISSPMVRLGNRGSSAFEEALLGTLAHLAKLGGDQLRLSRGIQELFGGAFECGTVLEGQLQKVAGVSYHFIDAELSCDQELMLDFRFTLTIGYFEDYLLVRRLSYGLVGNDELYVVRPPYRLVDDSERARLTASVEPPDFSSRLSVFYVHMPQAEPDSRLYVLAHKARAGDTAIFFEQDEGGFVMTINPEVFAKIRTHMQSGRDSHA
jgi:hypothetical protein